MYHWHYTGEYRGAAHRICNLRYSIPKEIYIVFLNECNYDYHFIIKMSKIIVKTIYSLGENTEKQNIFSSNRKRSYKDWQKWGRNYKNHILNITTYW